MLSLEEGEDEEALMATVVHPNIAAIFPQPLAVSADDYNDNEPMASAPRQGLAVPALHFPAPSSDEQSLE
jgi:hypothetical protein